MKKKALTKFAKDTFDKSARRYSKTEASHVTLTIKNLPFNVGDIRDIGLIPMLGRSSGEGNGNPLLCSCLENPMDRGAWKAVVHRVSEKSWMQLK